MRAGIPSDRAIATNSTVCSLQSPTFVRSTSLADGRLIVGALSSIALTSRVSRSARARPDDALHEALGLGADLRIVAFDEGLGLQVLGNLRVGRPRFDPPRIGQ